MALWISRQAARLLPADQRDRYCEEWECHILDKSRGPIDGRDGNHHLAALFWGVGTVPSALMRCQARKRIPDWLLADESTSFIIRSAAAVLNGVPIGVVGGVPLGMTAATAAWMSMGRFAGRFAELAFKVLVGMFYGVMAVAVDGMPGGLVFGVVYGTLIGSSVGAAHYGPEALNRIRNRFQPPSTNENLREMLDLRCGRARIRSRWERLGFSR